MQYKFINYPVLKIDEFRIPVKELHPGVESVWGILVEDLEIEFGTGNNPQKLILKEGTKFTYFFNTKRFEGTVAENCHLRTNHSHLFFEKDQKISFVSKFAQRRIPSNTLGKLILYTLDEFHRVDDYIR